VNHSEREWCRFCSKRRSPNDITLVPRRPTATPCALCGTVEPKEDRAHVVYGGERDHRTCIPKTRAADLLMREPQAMQYGGGERRERAQAKPEATDHDCYESECGSTFRRAEAYGEALKEILRTSSDGEAMNIAANALGVPLDNPRED
jgi:hypothetical protein